MKSKNYDANGYIDILDLLIIMHYVHVMMYHILRKVAHKEKTIRITHIYHQCVAWSTLKWESLNEWGVPTASYNRSF